MHLLMIGTLYVGVFAFCSMWYDYINLLFPDKLNFYYRAILEGVLVATSTLIVVFPVYIFTSYLLEKEIANDPGRRESWIRKWLVYLTLFVASIAIIIEVVRLIYNFQTGELTMNFFLKIFVTLVVAVCAFWYHLWDVKRVSGSVSTLPKLFAIISSVVVLGSVILSYFLFGSPAHQRLVRFDEQRVSDLQNIQSQVLSYWQQKEALPPALSDLTDSMSGFVPPIDPDTGSLYEYVVKGPLSFELCAVFGVKSISDTVPQYYAMPSAGGKVPVQENWSHEAGRKCFERTIDPAIYKINKPLPVVIQ